MPFAASASMFGVRQNLLPLQPSESNRCWSVVMKRILRPTERLQASGPGEQRIRGAAELHIGRAQLGEAFHLILERALRVGTTQQLDREGLLSLSDGARVGDEERERDLTGKRQQFAHRRSRLAPYAVDAGGIVELGDPAEGEGELGAHHVLRRG